MKPEWLIITEEDLEFERDQLEEEGKNVAALEDEFDRVQSLISPEESRTGKVEDRVDVVDSSITSDLPIDHQEDVADLLDRARELPERGNYPYTEPSNLDNIRRERPDGPRNVSVGLDDDDLYDHLYGAWLGRCVGCLLGKPVEGWSTDKLWSFLKDAENYPLEEYVRSDVPEDVIERHDIDPEGVFSSCIDKVDHMVEDDDTNYTVAGLSLLDSRGTSFTPDDVSRFWMRNIPILRTHTAERVAYRNFANTVEPPESARHRNPYREWIGAQIRADPYGYVAIGDPEQAAELAWRDASVSHVKNGIYGPMWVAAMLSVAPLESDIEKIITIGLSEIPEQSRLTEAINEVLNWHNDGLSYEDAMDKIHSRWDETYYHHWCHTISNAQIVAMGLLWGDGELGTSVCRAVHAGFDTDSHASTVGSIVGMVLGASKLPDEWISPLNNTIETGIDGYQRVPISELAEDTLKIYKNQN